MGKSKKGRLAALPARLQLAAGMRPRVRLAIRHFLLSCGAFEFFHRFLKAALRKGWPLNSAANRLHKLMRKRHRYSWASWLAAFLISVTGVLHGHDPGLSTAA